LLPAEFFWEKSILRSDNSKIVEERFLRIPSFHNKGPEEGKSKKPFTEVIKGDDQNAMWMWQRSHWA
jgi:hypothetical protein